MLKGGALLISIVLSLVIGSLTFFLLLFQYYSNLQLLEGQQDHQLLCNLNSGVNILLSSDCDLDHEEIRSFDLFGSANDSVTLTQRSWGVFKAGFTAAFNGRKRISRSFLFGGIKTNKSALYLSDLGQSLTISGKTVIRGLCYLPKSEVNKGFIEGQGFSGITLIEGEIRSSESCLPPMNEDLIADLRKMTATGFENDAYSAVSIENSGLKDSISNSFLNKTLILYSPYVLELSERSLSGNIILISSQKIRVSLKNNLSDIIMLAPVIEFEKGFVGSVQAFASDTLIVGENAELTYPSAVGIIENGQKKEVGSCLELRSRSRIEGVIFNVLPEKGNGNNSFISIGHGASIIGEVVSSGIVDLKGKITGSLICKKILLKTSSSVYENHLLNAEINSVDLPSYFVTSSILKPGENLVNGIIKEVE